MSAWLSRYRFSRIEVWTVAAFGLLMSRGRWALAIAIVIVGVLAQVIAESRAR